MLHLELKSAESANSTAVPADKHTIDQYLPQTQCTQCGYPSCIAYADALAQQSADINRCPPGGTATINALAQILSVEPTALADDCAPFTGRQIAKIDETQCIGCTLCIAPCPTDAIVGSAKHMHSVVAINCTGCGLCVDYCPVDCISMIANRLQITGEMWPHYATFETEYWRKLANKRRERCRSQPSDDGRTANLGASGMKQQIRDAVNRERQKRWKSKRQREVRTPLKRLS